MIIRSPTYTYYQKYGENIYHFDLYRLDVFQNFDSIGGGDIFDDEKNICLIEWPEILTVHYLATKTIHITLLDDGSRRIEIRTHRVPAIE